MSKYLRVHLNDNTVNEHALRDYPSNGERIFEVKDNLLIVYGDYGESTTYPFTSISMWEVLNK